MTGLVCIRRYRIDLLETTNQSMAGSNAQVLGLPSTPVEPECVTPSAIKGALAALLSDYVQIAEQRLGGGSHRARWASCSQHVQGPARCPSSSPLCSTSQGWDLCRSYQLASTSLLPCTNEADAAPVSSRSELP